MMKLLAGIFCVCAASSASALTVHTSPFIATVTATNDFELAPPGCCYDGTAGYTEQGITATYVGTPGRINFGFPLYGVRTWYPQGGSDGYTRLTFGGPVRAVQFLVGSGYGWFESPAFLFYDVRLGGVSIGSGIAGGAAVFGTSGSWYGFSGASFDEVRLQVRNDGGTVFDPAAYERGAFDMIQIGEAIPEPGTWAMLIAGFGLVGSALRSRRRRREAPAA